MAPLLRTQRDDKAFERLYERHVKDVFRYALAVLGERADAEDVTQTTFLNAYRAFQRGERPEKPQNWLIAIAHNVCRQRFRQQQRRPSEVELDDGIGAAVEPDDGTPTVEELRRAFAALAPNQRAALVMRELEGRRYDEIAEVLGISVSALETLLFRARRALREQLEGQLSCREAAFAISKELDGRLSAGERRGLRAHLRACPECARLASSQRSQRKALRALFAVPLPQSLQSFWPHAAETAAGGAAAGGTALAVKAAALVAAGTLVGGGAYEGVKHVPPLVEGSRPAAAHRAPPTPSATPVRRAALPVRAVHAAPVAPARHTVAKHTPKGNAKAHAATRAVAARAQEPQTPAAPALAHRSVVHAAPARRAVGAAKQQEPRTRAHPPAATRRGVGTHRTPHTAKASQRKPSANAHAPQHASSGAGAANGNGNGNAGEQGNGAGQAPNAHSSAPSVTLTIPSLPAVGPPAAPPGKS